jgi:hypothetical protein
VVNSLLYVMYIDPEYRRVVEPWVKPLRNIGDPYMISTLDAFFQ